MTSIIPKENEVFLEQLAKEIAKYIDLDKQVIGKSVSEVREPTIYNKEEEQKKAKTDIGYKVDL